MPKLNIVMEDFVFSEELFDQHFGVNADQEPNVSCVYNNFGK